MIDNRNRRIRVGDKIYHIYWELIADLVEWQYREYIIHDMYYSDNCYAVLTDTKNNITHVKMLNHKSLVDWYYTEEEAQDAIVREKSIQRSYAWGTYSDNGNYAKSSCERVVIGIPSIVETEEVETPDYCEKAIKEREMFLKKLQKLLKVIKEVFK